MDAKWNLVACSRSLSPSSSPHALCRNWATGWHAHLTGHTIPVRVKASGHAIHHQRAKPLSLGDGTIFVSQEECFQVDNFLTQLSHRGGESIILSGEKLNLGLEIGQPLLFPLTTFQSSNPWVKLEQQKDLIEGVDRSIPIPFQEIPPLFFVCHFLGVHVGVFHIFVLRVI